MEIEDNKFDLNIEEILENWEIYDAIREVIANALDEQKLTETNDLEIYKDDDNKWHIRDYGRGLKHEHLTQKENKEKIEHPHLIGKFGIGLKDALATFDRQGGEILIKSKYNDITTGIYPKAGFEDIKTLHAVLHDPSDPNFEGTDVILGNISQDDMDKAKALFLKFSGDELVESTEYGDVYRKKSETSNIYINGVKVNEEDNFLYSYNITSLTKAIKDKLNRERSNVGRDAYRDRIKSILLKCESVDIGQDLSNDLRNINAGTSHDELNWKAIQLHAVKILSSKKEIITLTSTQILDHPEIVDNAMARGVEIIPITDMLREDLRNTVDISGKRIRDIDYYIEEEHESFEFNWVNPDKLTHSERNIFDLTDKIFGLIGGRPSDILEIKISETMRKDPITYRESNGLWDEDNGWVILKRNRLKNICKFGGTLLHETAHCISGKPDVNRDFELILSQLLGTLCSKILDKDGIL